MIFFLIFLSKNDVQDRGKAPTTIEKIAIDTDEDIPDIPNPINMVNKKLKKFSA